MVDLHAETRGPLDIQTLLAQAEKIVAAARDAPPPLAPPQEDLAFLLRTRLAVRGWVNPRRLFTGAEPPDEVSRALNAVAGETDSAFATRPGDWYLSIAGRKRVLASRGGQALRDELDVIRCEGDVEDPTRAAFRLAMAIDPLPPLSILPEEILRALANVLDWLGPMAAVEVDRGRIAAELAARSQRRDVALMTALPMVGEGHQAALAELTDRLGRPLAKGLETTYVYGSGGAGKSTLLAFLQRDLVSAGQPITIARIDFDDPAINAADQASLDLALFGQLGQLLPDMIPHFAQASEALRTQRRYLREDSVAPRVARGPVRKQASMAVKVTSLESESADTGARSERQSIVFGLLGPWTGPQMARPLVVILDTAELVMSLGDAAVVEIVSWISSLQSVMAAEDVRVVIAGRDPPAGPGSNDLLDQLGAVAHLHPPIALGDLDVDEAAQLLADSGVKDPATARAAAAAVPRNPLLLRIIADALKSDSKLAAEVRAAHADSRIDRQSANAYLARRIVAHLADPVARPYLLASMYLPSITRPQLRDIVIPAVDGGKSPPNPRRAARVFAALRSARWLARPGADPRLFTFHRDIRALVLKLLAADPDHGKLEQDLRRRAVAVHKARSSSRDRAYGLYHHALLGKHIWFVNQPAVVARHLHDVLDDLPDQLRSVLFGGAGSPSPWVETSTPASDEEWRHYLEGEGSRDGEGARLLKRDRAAEAVKLYRSRPTQPHGVPPTFVIRALADLGEWGSGEVDVPAVLDEARAWLTQKRLSGPALSRLYWITRFALVRDGAILTDEHASVLAAGCERMTGASLSSIPSLIAVAEAGLDREIMPPRMRGGRGAIESATRVHLIHCRRTRRPISFKSSVDVLAVFQRDWRFRLRRDASRCVDANLLKSPQREIDDFDGNRIAAMNPMLNTMREPLTVQWDAEDMDAGILLLRGQTTEFIRPLRQALLELHLESAESGLLGDIAGHLSQRMSIRPLELHRDVFLERIEHDPGAWIAAFVGFVDRCRLLPSLCERLVKQPGDTPAAAKARRVAKSFLAWDLAICGGARTSDWTIDGAPE